MTEEIGFEMERQQESWFGSWLRWCPTSLSLLREAEKMLLSNLKSLYRGRYVNVGCTVGAEESHIWTLSFNEESTKIPLVLLHGFGSGVGLWCLNYDALAAKRPVYAIDIVGFGRSSRPQFTRDPWRLRGKFITNHARVVGVWRRRETLQKFILLGHSFGGFLAASYSIKHPERISHLILADPWGFPERPLDVGRNSTIPLWVRAIGAILQPFNPLFIVRTAGPWGPKLLQKARPDLIRKFSGVVKDSEEVIPNYLYHCNAQNPTGESAFHALMAGFGWAKYPMIHRMDSLRKEVPITLIYGSRSWVDRDPGFQIKYTRQDSYVDVVVIKGAGHHVYADRAEVFNELVNYIGDNVGQWYGLPKKMSMNPDLVEACGEARNAGASLTNMLTCSQLDDNHARLTETSHICQAPWTYLKQI
ncbi:LOW QUALITY PROTEIN: (Lyso)-N-acylphosphatidylethanolamine lipase-like [Penaeus monodon]|uniref:LOW QUALITY PROTEIN: (Lyso)-N-acylphosphatidylethanolamine lipase-like n=1 Tax=Penaeus monodon TaxID=6687 RepID=UPI0018A71485|nr:LOW QUALITY PROTEIN: (Lyso)-N-acylphosphatidylethanolamine lipase-like [Penaeus monodon]